MKPPVLIINSYGGSLTQATVSEQHPVIASMEDSGFGIDTQMLNFPGLRYVREFADWPIDINLKDSIVIAHPPCSGFSSQNRSKSADIRGAYSHAFACTTRILDYVLPRRPEAVIVESVPGAMEGARPIHDHYAKAYGYNLYRVMQNAASFATPQWRRRFWAVFVRKAPGRANQFNFRIKHDVKYLGDVLNPETIDQNIDASHKYRWEKQLTMAKDLGYPEDKFRELLNSGKHQGNLIRILSDVLQVPKEKGWPPYGKLHDHVVGGNFLSGALTVLSENGLAPVLLGTAWWWYRGQMLGYADYKQIMGFPREYQFHKDRMTLVLLSKGVCPPVARWLLREVNANVFGIKRPPEVVNYDVVENLHLHQNVTIEPGEIADLRTPDSLRERKAA